MRNPLFALCLAVACAGAAVPAEAQVPDDPMATPEMIAISAALARIRAGDPSQVPTVILPAAEAGNARAQNILAGAYENGWAVPADPALALEWYRRSAAQGYPVAIRNLGIIHTFGRLGLPPDPETGRAWFGRAVALDYPPAMADYALMLIRGIGGPEEPARGVEILERGVTLGDAQSHYQLGYLYFNGGPVEPDPERARELYEVAGLMGVADAMLNIGVMMQEGQGGPTDAAAAEVWYARAMAAGQTMGAFYIADILARGPEAAARTPEILAHCAWALDRSEEPVAYWTVWCEDQLAAATPEARARALKDARSLVATD